MTPAMRKSLVLALVGLAALAALMFLRSSRIIPPAPDVLAPGQERAVAGGTALLPRHLAAGQAPAAAPARTVAPAEPPSSHGLLVTVADIGAGTIAGARLESDDHTVATTDANGRAQIAAGTLPASGELCAEADGYAVACARFTLPGTLALRLHPGNGIDGVVVRADDGRAVPGALVTAGNISAESDAAGHFALRGLPPGSHRLEARTQRLYGRLPRAVSLGMGRVEVGVRLEVGAAVLVQGRVTRGGQPATAGSIWLVLDEDQGELDDSGRFRFSGVPPGKHTLRTRGPLAEWSRPDRLLEVRDRDVEVNIELGDLHAVEVLVTDERAAPVADVRVEGTVTHDGTRAKVRCQTDARGRCVLGQFSEGAVVIKDLAAVGGTPIAVELPVAGPVRLTTAGLGRIEGLIRSADGRPLRRRVVQVEAQPQAPTGDARSFLAVTTTEPSGAFVFAHVPAGSHRLSVRPSASGEQDDLMISRGDEQPELTESLQILPGETLPVHLTLRQGDRLQGVVLEPGGGPAADTIVIYRPDPSLVGDPDQGMDTAVTDDSGRFSFEAVPVGQRYRITAYRNTGERVVSPPVLAGGAPLRLELAPAPAKAASR
jgi:hypothetical protein